MPTSVRIVTTVLLTLGTVLAGCGGSGAALEDVPDWVTDKPDSDQTMYGAGTGAASSLQTAIDKSKMRARGDIASSIEAQLLGMTKDFREEVSGEERAQFTQTREQVVSQVLRGTAAEEQEIVREDGKYRAYTLMRMPIGPAAREFLSQLEKSEELYTRFRSSEAFEEMRKRVEEYESKQESTRAPENQ